MLVELGIATSRRSVSTASTTAPRSGGNSTKRLRRRLARRHPTPIPRKLASRRKLDKYESSRTYAGIQRISATSRKRTRNDERNRATRLSILPDRHLPLDHVIRRRRRSHVADVVQIVRRVEDDRSRPTARRDTVLQRLDLAFFYNEQLFLRMLVRRMRHLARVQCGDVHLELVERRRRRAHHGTNASGRGGSDFELVPIEHGRSDPLTLCAQREGRADQRATCQNDQRTH